MKADDIKKVFFIGCGTIVQYVATQCALFGCDVVIYAFRKEEIEESKKAIMQRILPPIIEAGMTTQAHAEASMNRMRYILTKEEIPTDLDLISESVFEDPQVKKAIWAEFAPYLPEHAVLTTNTSTMLPSVFADSSGAPERFLSWHFTLNTFFKNLADVMPHAGTDPAYTQIMVDFSRRIGLNPVVMEKELGSYLANSMLTPLLVTALKLHSSGYAAVEDIDRSWMIVHNAALGPFGIIDGIGLMTIDYCVKDLMSEEELIPLRTLIEQGHLGVKTGKGFYTYPNPTYKQPGFITPPAPVGL